MDPLNDLYDNLYSSENFYYVNSSGDGISRVEKSISPVLIKQCSNRMEALHQINEKLELLPQGFSEALINFRSFTVRARPVITWNTF